MTDGEFVLPTGTVTLLLADVEGSTRRWEADPDAMRSAIVSLNELVDDAIGRHDGVRPVEQGEGDSFVAAFARATDALACAVCIQQQLLGSEIRLRIGLHTGEVQRRDETNYVGQTINRTARLRDIAHGGQTVLSQTAHDLVVDRLLEGVTLCDLGVHRLKDLARPERVFQLCHPDVPSEFPRLRSLDSLPHNLPQQRTSFIGRDAELSEVRALLTPGSLVTLVGSGGCGKTRLALQVAAEALNDHPDGAWFADLAAVVEPSAVPAQVAACFGLREGLGLTPTQSLCAYLEQRRALLILDNCEHVADAAATLADALLAGCPQLTLLATSRQPLGLDGEITWRVPSLAVPADDGPPGIAGVSSSAAAELFVERARRARPGFELTERNAEAVAQICRRLDGIPLAIELAAARSRVFTPVQIADGLAERFRLLTGGARTAMPRQQTLEASIDWSHQLLTDPERAVLRQLSVFAGDFTFEAAEDVCAGGDVERHQVLDLLSLLVDKSLVVADEDAERARYRMLDTVRAYARARLVESGAEPSALLRHRNHYLSLVEDAEHHLEGPGQVEWMGRLAQDYPNIRAALQYSLERREADALARLASALVLLWITRGPASEGAEWLDTALALGADLPPARRAKTYCARAIVAAVTFDIATGTSAVHEGLALAEQTDDQRLLVRLKLAKADVASMAQVPTPVTVEAVELARKSGDSWAVAQALQIHAVSLLLTDAPGARSALQESISLAQASGNIVGVQLALAFLSAALEYSGQFADAERAAREALHLCEQNVNAMSLTLSLGTLAEVLLFTGDTDAAIDGAERLERTGRELGYPMFAHWAARVRGMAALAEGRISDALALLEQAAATSFLPTARATCLVRLAEAELASGALESAQRHLDEAIAASEAAQYRWGLGSALVVEARVARVRHAFHDAAHATRRALTVAAAASVSDVVAEAIEVLAGVTLEAGDLEGAARYFGAARAVRDTTGYVLSLTERDDDISRLRCALEPPRFAEAYESGRGLSIDEAVAYANRGSGKRGGPSTGWDSLSPAEAQIVELVTAGMTNPEIGQRMFVSHRTVQTHLTHIFAKLGVTSRTELAAAAVRRNG